MCIVPDRCNITYDRRLVPTETPEDAIAEIQAIIDRLSAEDPDFHATVKVSAVPRTTYTGITETKPNIKEGWRIAEDHPFVAAASNGLRSIGEPVSYGYWDFGTDLAMVSGRHHIASIGYSPMRSITATARSTNAASTSGARARRQHRHLPGADEAQR